ncbi:palmitoyltransferase akr1 [Borealophlyctis nickersoniae]|nr:palmitoyltransferase akr1 [Borealophlyctis nickersoniae]
MLTDERRQAKEPLLSNFTETVVAAASTLGSTVAAVASGDSSIVRKHHHHHHHSHGHGHENCNHDHGHAEDGNEDDSFATKTIRGGDVRLDTLPNIHELDLFQASQRGVLPRVMSLIESGAATPMDRDKENCTALHWAAINNQLPVAKFLVDRGAEIDAYGGHSYMVAYLLAIGMDVDAPDSMGRTALMWAAYQGNSVDSMEELLRGKAALDIADPTGYTAMHWAAISNHVEPFAEILIKAGARADIKDPEGKTAIDWAKERGMGDILDQMLVRSGAKPPPKGRGADGKPYDKRTANRIIYAVPFVAIPVLFNIFSMFPIYVALPLVMVLLWAIQTIFIVRYLMAGDRDMVHTPLMTSIPQATLFYAFVTWLRVVPYTGFLYIQHIMFLSFFGICIYSFYKGIVGDPGYIRKAGADERHQQMKAIWTPVIIAILAGSESQYGVNIVKFATVAWRNSTITARGHTIAVFGTLNHRYFMFFILTLVPGAGIFVYIVFSYLSALAPSAPADADLCPLLTPSACAFVTYDTWSLLTACWTSFNMFWVFFLVLAQSAQIAMGKTTNESANWFRFAYMVHPDDRHLPVYRRRMMNPFDLGVVGNCVEFWTDKGGLSDVNWFTVYEVPPKLLKQPLGDEMA